MPGKCDHFFSPLFLCVPSTRLFVDVYQGSLSLSLSLSLSVTLSENISPTSTPHAPTLFTLSHFFIGRRPRVETAHWARSTLECCLKLSSMCAWHVSSRCPTDTHFMLMSCLGSAIRERGRERQRRREVSLLPPPSTPPLQAGRGRDSPCGLFDNDTTSSDPWCRPAIVLGAQCASSANGDVESISSFRMSVEMNDVVISSDSAMCSLMWPSTCFLRQTKMCHLSQFDVIYC